MGLIFLGVLVFFTLASGSAAADTPKSGTITSDETWTQAMSPIWVEGSITVTNGATLTIDPGVEIRFDGYYSLTVSDGALVADGDAAGAGVITFTSNFTTPWPGAWAGINIYDDDPASVLDDSVISYASTGITFDDASVPVTNTQILESQWYGVYVASSAAPYSLSFAGCTISNAGSYGMYINSQSDNDLDLTVQGCTFSNYGSAGIFFSWLQYANFTITLDGNSFNASNRAVYFGNTFWGDVDEGNTFRFTFSNNWVNSSLDSYAIYAPFDIDYFAETTLTISGNQFVGMGSRSYGVYLDDFQGAAGSNQSLTMAVTNNEFTDLGSTGVFFDWVWDFRHVTFDFSGNVFQNTDGIVLDYGVYGDMGPYYTQDTQDSTYTLRVEDNTAVDLSSYAVYFWGSTSDGYRDVTIRVNRNDFRNTRDTPYMDYGVYLQPFRWDGGAPSTLVLTVNDNTIQDLDDYGVYLNSFTGFRTVSLEATGNAFANVLGPWMEYGLYLPSGIDDADDLTFAFRDNQATGLNSYALYASGFSGTTTSSASFELSRNTIRDADYGVYLGSISDYDLSAGVLVEDNVLTDIDFAGIHLGSHYRTDSRVIVRSNTVTGLAGTSGPAAIILEGFQYQSAQVDIVSNTVLRATVGIEVDDVAYGSGETTLTIQNNDIQEVESYGIFIYQIHRASGFVNISENTITAVPGMSSGASLLAFYYGDSGWDQAFVDLDITNNVLQDGLHGLYFYGTNGEGTTVLVDIRGLTVTGSAFGLTLDYPVNDPADIFNFRLRDSTFQNNHRGFLSINRAGTGLLPINITGTQVIDFGDWGGYAIYMGSNVGGVVKLDVWTSDFQAALGSLGDVYAGSGPVTMNFYFINSITKGEAKDSRQIIQTLWKTDVRVLKGKNLDVPAPGVTVYAMDQFGTRGFISVTGSDGMVRDQYVSGHIIAYQDGMSYAGPAIQTVVAEWGPFNGTTTAMFSSNGEMITVFLPGDADGDGLNDQVDPDDDNDGIVDERDENPLSSGFLDFRAAPYYLHLWVIVGFVGLVALPLAIRIWLGSAPADRKKGKDEDEWVPPPE